MAQHQIERDARVVGAEGEIGRVKHVVVDRETREVTELVVEGDGREWLVPMSAVADSEGGRVILRGALAEQAQPFERDAFDPVDDEAHENRRQPVGHGGPELDPDADTALIGTAPLGSPPARPGRADADAGAVDDTRPISETRPVPNAGPAADTQLIDADGPAPARRPEVRWDPDARRAPEARPEPEVEQRVGQEEVRVPLAMEVVDVEKRQREIGAVEIQKRVVEEEVVVPTELTREDLRVSRVNLPDRRLTDDERERAFREGTLTIRIRGEQVFTRKQTVVAGEVVVEKDHLTDRHRISEVVRKERVEIEELGEANING